MTESTSSERLFELLNSIEERYHRTAAWLRQYTPYAVRGIEIVLAVALLALLALWINTVYLSA